MQEVSDTSANEVRGQYSLPKHCLPKIRYEAENICYYFIDFDYGNMCARAGFRTNFKKINKSI